MRNTRVWERACGLERAVVEGVDFDDAAAAVVVSVGLMMLFASAIGNFVSDHPTIKTLALSFLMVVGVALIADGFDTHVPKGYIYFAMAFSVIVEMLHIRLRKRKAAATGNPS